MEKDYRSNTNRQSRLRRVVAGPIAGLALAAAWLAAGTPAQAAEPAISGNVVRIGLLLDMSGVYADISGKGTATAAQMAIDDFGGSVMGKKIELLVADHQMKADVASSKAREWFDEQKVATIWPTRSPKP